MGRIIKTNVTDQVYEKIKENIVNGVWKEGDRIPSETELADYYGVSRISVRTALQKLKILGFIETYDGEGSFVKKFSLINIFRGISSDIIMDDSSISELKEFRKNTELDCCRLAIERGTDEEIVHLETILSEMEKKALNDDIEGFLEYDHKLHMQIAKMSRNSLYEVMFEVTKETLNLYNKDMYNKSRDKFRDDLQKIWEFPILNHKAIVNSIKNRNINECKNAYLQMIQVRY
ncbi:MAG: FadR/GntR family transcriptional regulator [Tissierellaceae bacterium]|nr:FadR/GntR family transcriptional regulator [Tissierellaceae bacterium]